MFSSEHMLSINANRKRETKKWIKVYHRKPLEVDPQLPASAWNGDKFNVPKSKCLYANLDERERERERERDRDGCIWLPQDTPGHSRTAQDTPGLSQDTPGHLFSLKIKRFFIHLRVGTFGKVSPGHYFSDVYIFNTSLMKIMNQTNDAVVYLSRLCCSGQVVPADVDDDDVWSKSFQLIATTLGIFVNNAFLVEKVRAKTALPAPVDGSWNPEITIAVVLKPADVAITVQGNCRWHLEDMIVSICNSVYISCKWH